MDAQTVKDLADQIALHLPAYSWKALALQIVLMILAAGVGAFLGEYLRTRGRHFATKADFESLSAQLRASTEVVARVNSEVARRDWTEREWTSLRRQKLEALLEKVHALGAYLDRVNELSANGFHSSEPSPEGEIVTIGILYIPELRRELTNVLVRAEQTLTELRAFAKAMAAAKDDPASRSEILKKHRETIMRPEFKAAVEELLVASRPVLLRISGLPQDQA